MFEGDVPEYYTPFIPQVNVVHVASYFVLWRKVHNTTLDKQSDKLDSLQLLVNNRFVRNFFSPFRWLISQLHLGLLCIKMITARAILL